MEETSIEFRIYSRDNLETLFKSIDSYAKELIGEYIWHKEPWRISLDKQCITGSINVGECIDDEWFIVYILREISAKFDSVAIT